jgi:hypothetical protein
MFKRTPVHEIPDTPAEDLIQLEEENRCLRELLAKKLRGAKSEMVRVSEIDAPYHSFVGGRWLSE